MNKAGEKSLRVLSEVNGKNQLAELRRLPEDKMKELIEILLATPHIKLELADQRPYRDAEPD